MISAGTVGLGGMSFSDGSSGVGAMDVNAHGVVGVVRGVVDFLGKLGGVVEGLNAIKNGYDAVTGLPSGTPSAGFTSATAADYALGFAPGYVGYPGHTGNFGGSTDTASSGGGWSDSPGVGVDSGVGGLY